ncbi:uncharacterized protein B0I36DRAFT_364372 [Microdochium trichocladiopsis]|uniref:Uncharacterized protein n=1 Tax=Microdochium trichocladiopsis TaxID=1682393 RepID=A0A9P8Y893_9PEZI|nr:uncharacterized protein B0I36DRAFT_364372 [Microdochium trichocladiopsis]KAH7029902.1 hypothetical protein B0I36DRAFT_364372 [Microdochium trichocladiopsis]
MVELGRLSLTSYGELILSVGCVAAGFGAVCVILFCVSAGIHETALHRHRAAGGRCDAQSSAVAPAYQPGGYPVPNQAMATNLQWNQPGQFATTMQMAPLAYQQMPANMYVQQQQMPASMPMEQQARQWPQRPQEVHSPIAGTPAPPRSPPPPPLAHAVPDYQQGPPQDALQE